MPNTLLDTKLTSDRKKDHLELTFVSQTIERDKRFYYEPLLNSHPSNNLPKIIIANKTMSTPLWVSSMTGGTEKASLINQNLAKACNDFGMGMGLGSCRIILKDNTYFNDFNVRPILGDNLPFFANLGIAQMEELLETNSLHLADELVNKLSADGLIIHVNPFQEWLQPEGDHLKYAPIDTIKRTLDKLKSKIIIKEVGQGMGPMSLIELIKLPIEAIEFGAHGGTNFATLELHRQDEMTKTQLQPLTTIGHSAEEMVNYTNQILTQIGDKALCKNLIISGGIKNYLDGYYLMKKSKFNSVYAQASAFLKYATGEYEDLYNYCKTVKNGLEVCYQYLNLRETNEQ